MSSTRSLFRAILVCLLVPIVGFASVRGWGQDSSSKPCTPTVVGTLETFELTSMIFENKRTVRVWLPPGYGEAANRERKYPVLYMFDGQNLFDACLAFDHVHEWQVDETVTRLVGEGKIEPLMVVGIDNGGEKRAYEYLPWADRIQHPEMPPPAGTRLPEFLIQDVMPAVEAKYRVAKGRESTGIGGSSYGGIAALYVGVTAPVVFGKVLAESPILHVGNLEMVRYTSPQPVGPLKVFFGYGGKESKTPGVDEAVVKMIHVVEGNLKNAAVWPSEVKVVYDPEAMHNEAAWAKRLPEALEFLFPAPK